MTFTLDKASTKVVPEVRPKLGSVIGCSCSNEPEVVRGDSMPPTGGPNGKQIPAPFFNCFVPYVIVKDIFQDHGTPLGRFPITVRTFEPLMSRHAG